jgi:hypothetical protein
LLRKGFRHVWGRSCPKCVPKPCSNGCRDTVWTVTRPLDPGMTAR